MLTHNHVLPCTTAALKDGRGSSYLQQPQQVVDCTMPCPKETYAIATECHRSGVTVSGGNGVTG